MTGSEPVPQSEHAPDHVSDGTAASRRTFIAGASAATVAGAAIVAVGTTGTAAAATTATVTTSGASAPAAGRGGPAVVAYVRDLADGEIRLLSGDREVVVQDRALARTLARHLDALEG